MRKLLVLGILLIGQQFYDAQGNYQGMMDNQGHIYDSSGNYQGQIDRRGNMYDAYGNYQGQVKPDNTQTKQFNGVPGFTDPRINLWGR